METSSDDRHPCLSQIWSRYEVIHSKMSCPTSVTSDAFEWEHSNNKNSREQVIDFNLCNFFSPLRLNEEFDLFPPSLKTSPRCFGKWTLHICVQLWAGSLCDHCGWASNLDYTLRAGQILPAAQRMVERCELRSGSSRDLTLTWPTVTADFRLWLIDFIFSSSLTIKIIFCRLWQMVINELDINFIFNCNCL